MNPASEIDILVRSPNGQPIAAVEIKNPERLSRNTASTVRRNMLVHGLLPGVPYFLLLSQDIGFLWKGAEQKAPDAPPTFQFPMREVVERYLPNSDAKKRLRESELEWIVLQWLLNLTISQRDTKDEPEKSLAQAGLLDSLRGATVLADARL